MYWGLGIGDWGLGIGIGPNPQSPIPNPHSLNKIIKDFIDNYLILIYIYK